MPGNNEKYGKASWPTWSSCFNLQKEGKFSDIWIPLIFLICLEGDGWDGNGYSRQKKKVIFLCNCLSGSKRRDHFEQQDIDGFFATVFQKNAEIFGIKFEKVGSQK